MKNFLKRLFGFANETAAQPLNANPAATKDPVPDTRKRTVSPEPAWQAPSAIDALFMDWLLATSPQRHDRRAPKEAMEKAIIAALEKLSKSELAGSNLLPRVPSVLPQLLKSLREENVSEAELARHIGKDMVLVAELIQEVNSAHYHRLDKIIHLDNAIRLLGLNGLRMLAAKVAFRPIIHLGSGHLTKLAAPHIWEHADKCALACQDLAQQRRQDPFAGFLGGLMQNVGLVVACRIVDHVCEPENIPDSPGFQSALLDSARVLSCNIARHWDFPKSVIDAIEQTRQIYRQRAGLSLSLYQADALSKIYLLAKYAGLDDGAPALQIEQDRTILTCYTALKARAEQDS